MILKKTIAVSAGMPPLEMPLDDDELLQRQIDEATHLLSVLKDKQVRIKTLASNKILAIADEHQQRNMIAEALELSITNSNPERLGELTLIWSRIKAIRAASNTIEEAFNNSEDQINFDIEAGWPE